MQLDYTHVCSVCDRAGRIVLLYISTEFLFYFILEEKKKKKGLIGNRAT